MIACKDLNDSTVKFFKEMDPSVCDKLKMCKKHPFYLTDLHSKFNEIQKHLQSKDVTIIQAQTILIGFQIKKGSI